MKHKQCFVLVHFFMAFNTYQNFKNGGCIFQDTMCISKPNVQSKSIGLSSHVGKEEKLPEHLR